MNVRSRLLASFILIVVVTVIFMEFLLLNLLKKSYYDNLKKSMYTQIKISADYYEKFYSDSSLYENVLYNIDTFWNQSQAMVQIYDNKGNLIMDSEGLNSTPDTPVDVSQALQGSIGYWTGYINVDSPTRSSSTKEAVMSVSYPLTSGDTVLGSLRFITSLNNINSEISKLTFMFIAIGLGVIILCSFLSALLSHYIVVPIKFITKVAEKMASGNFTARCKKINIEEIQKLSTTLNFMAEEIVKKDQLKNHFISSVSHELRTPLTAIKGWAITLKNSNISDKGLILDGLNIIENESNRLTSMVEELLDFSKIISGNIKIINDWVNVTEIFDHLKLELTPRIQKENIDFQIDYKEEIPLIYTDKNRIKQIFLNLLDNAFKFTPSGGRIKLVIEKDKNYVLFSVIDTGCGIPEDELPKVKEKFYKGKNSKSQNGIGLSICDEIIKLMKGTFDIQSQVDVGTQIFIRLPIEEE